VEGASREDRADRRHRVVELVERFSRDLRLAAVGPREPQDHVDRCRLAGPVGPRKPVICPGSALKESRFTAVKWR
jgi:hypothetical protein